MPVEGANADRPRAGDVARTDAPTCRLEEAIGEVRGRVRAAGWDACVVVNDDGVVLGMLREAELDRGGGAVAQVMRPGPSTFRPHVAIEEMARFMTDHDLPTSPITSSDGRLIGVLRKEDAVRVAHELHHHGGAEEAP
jgi:Mg/Co/Ni transporter MgtE